MRVVSISFPHINFYKKLKLYIMTPNINYSCQKWIKNLVIIRLLRLFRFFKLSYGLQVILHTLNASIHELSLLFIILLIPLVVFSSLVYAFEYDNKHPNKVPITTYLSEPITNTNTNSRGSHSF